MAKRQMSHEPRPIFRVKDQIRQLKPKVPLEVIVTGGASEPIQWGDWGLAVMLDIAYTHPRDGKLVEIRQALRIRRDEPFSLREGERAELACWGVMPGGMLRHPLLTRSDSLPHDLISAMWLGK
jgi:hypothetical protein